MKASQSIVTGFLLMTILTFWFDAAHAAPSVWPNSKAEIYLENCTTGGLATLSVMRIIGNHYLVHGIVTDLSGDKTLVNGNAEVDGNTVLMNISASGYIAGGDGEVHGTIGSVELDASTLEGYFRGIEFHCEGFGDVKDCVFGPGVEQLLAPAGTCTY